MPTRTRSVAPRNDGGQDDAQMHVTSRVMRLYYNPDCSKSRAALRLLENAGHRPTLVDYLSQPLDSTMLAQLLDRLDGEPDALIRRTDASAAEWMHADEPALDRKRVIEILIVEPALMQRPILEVEDRALIARPPERVFELVDAMPAGSADE